DRSLSISSETAQEGDLLGQDLSTDPPAVRSSGIQRLVFDLPCCDGLSPAQVLDCGCQQRAGGGADLGVIGHDAAVGDYKPARKPIRKVVLGPTRGFHADAEHHSLLARTGL